MFQYTAIPTGDAFLALKNDLGCTKRKLYHGAGHSPPRFYAILRANSDIRLSTLVRYANAAQLPLDVFISYFIRQEQVRDDEAHERTEISGTGKVEASP